ncbi:hypothetical protein GC089_06095 [Cellulomonas sp. JZ18]|uniref:hypothetical protein n=1 Tax=Cellulomonas sp. JZ18 TaxID=2654191 RepID=UPI0012D451F5|nr:hypothetical protein [Cellulomonas sp. JZ18]QGQ18891.1 hypothetical protein GC089_06095 [Cellulomonas sp. JZ18]
MTGPAPAPGGWRARGAALVGAHGRALAGLGVVTVVGVVATAGFQLVVIRGLGPVEYGLFASLLAFLNVASIGSGALRNSVAVDTAASRAAGSTAGTPARRLLDGSAVEALVLGLVCTVAGVVAAPYLTASLDTTVVPVLVVAAAALPYFVFSRSQGLLQGAGDSRAVVLWSTAAQVAQFLLSALVVRLGGGALGVLLVFLGVGVVGALGASAQARVRRLVSGARPFSADALVVIALTIAFAWLTSVDVVLVRSGALEADAGAYAAAAVLVKTTLIVPTTLSLYLLPRFVSARDDTASVRLGVNLSLALALVTGLAVWVVVTVAGGLVVRVFGGGYEQATAVLPALALAWVPWAMAQSLLIRLTAAASRWSLVVLVLVAAAQWVLGRLVLPDVDAFVVVNAGVGAVALGCMFVVHLRLVRQAGRTVQAPTDPAGGPGATPGVPL